MSRCLASLHRVLAGARSPASSVLSRHYDTLPPIPPHFVAFAWRYHRSNRLGSSLPTPPTAGRRAWGWSPGIPCRDFFRGDDRASQVPGEPPYPFAHVLRPRPAEAFLTTNRTLTWLCATGTTRAPTPTILSRLNSMAFGLAVYVSHCCARLASRCWSGSPGRAWYPQGSDERFQTHLMFAFLLSQASWHDPV